MSKKGFSRAVRMLCLLCLFAMVSAIPDHAVAQEPLGGEFQFIFGASTGAFKTDTGFFFGGALDVPLFASDPLFGQALLGEIMIGWSRTKASLTSVSPLVVVGAPADAVTATDVELTTVQIAIDFKYKLDKLIQPVVPYVLFGPSLYIFFSNTSGAPLGGDFVGGIAPLPAELQEINFPAGQGNVEVGANLGVGVDLYITKKLFIGAEYRYNAVVGENTNYGTFGGKLGLRF